MGDSFLKFWRPTPEEVLATVEQGQHDRAQRLAEEATAQRQAELDIKLTELRQLDEHIGSLLAEKATLHQRIHGKLSALIPDLVRLDTVEIEGTALSGQVLTLQIDTHRPMGSHWRDPKLSGVSMLLKTWAKRLEG